LKKGTGAKVGDNNFTVRGRENHRGTKLGKALWMGIGVPTGINTNGHSFCDGGAEKKGKGGPKSTPKIGSDEPANDGKTFGAPNPVWIKP